MWVFWWRINPAFRNRLAWRFWFLGQGARASSWAQHVHGAMGQVNQSGMTWFPLAWDCLSLQGEKCGTQLRKITLFTGAINIASNGLLWGWLFFAPQSLFCFFHDQTISVFFWAESGHNHNQCLTKAEENKMYTMHTLRFWVPRPQSSMALGEKRCLNCISDYLAISAFLFFFSAMVCLSWQETTSTY